MWEPPNLFGRLEPRAAVHAAGASAVCSAEQNALQLAFAGYQQVMDSIVGLTADEEARRLKHVADSVPTIDPTDNPRLRFDFDVNWDMKSFDVPGVTVGTREQEWVYKVPQVTMRPRDISFDFLASRLVDRKVGQYPEETCEWRVTEIGLGIKTKTLACTTTWHDIITKVPEFYTETKTFRTDVPEIAMRNTRTVISMPALTITRERVMLRIPEFRVRWPDDIRNEEERRAEQQASTIRTVIDQESQQSQARISQSVSHAQGQAAVVAIPAVNTYFNCMRGSMTTQRDAVAGMFRATLAQQDATLALLQAQGASDTPDARAIRAAADNVRLEAEAQARSMDALLESLDRQEKELIARLTRTTQTPPMPVALN
jgi:hypothetical protein